MKWQFEELQTGGVLWLIKDEKNIERMFFGDRKDKLLTVAWNTGAAQQVIIDEVAYPFPSQHVLPLMVNQSFRFEHPESIVAWQFNRDFYCIVDHDKEVSCVGFLFYGSAGVLFVQLDEEAERKFELLQGVFVDEFATKDSIQGEMLRMLVKRLIIIVTRLAKSQCVDENVLPLEQLNSIRHFNLLVEQHYRKQHQVGFYAGLLHKSPKTLSNLFALYNHKSPLQVIHNRVIMEAKRLFYYTDKSAKEIGYELGFEDAGHFSRFFKKETGLSPSEFKNSLLIKP